MDNPQITIDQGTLKGTTGTDLNGRKYYSFFGIPYAKPPLGALRFKAPQPPEKWTGIREATTNTGACYAKNELQPTLRAGSEDCLVLNVYTPELPNDKTELKPVMVWIHGGAFTGGSNNTMVYGPEFLITEDVVIVAINYRLGLLGFLSIDDPNVGVPGNAGLKDMVMALKWVQGNIKSFGGDPNNVTIFGESAGGAAVHYLVLSPMTKGLFHRAIAQSGCALNSWALARPSAKDLAAALYYTSTNDADILSYLQSLPLEKFYDGQESFKDRIEVNYTRLIGPVVEKVTPNEPAFLSEHPLDVLINGNYNKIPLIMGYTEVEGLLFDLVAKQTGKSFITDFEELILPTFKLERGSDASKAVAKKIKTFYFGNDEPSQENILKQYTIQSDASFNYGIQQSIRFHSLASNEHLYLYRFTVDGNMNFIKKIANIKHPGACHGDDLGYLFKNFFTPGTLDFESLEGKTVKRMVKLWTNFAKTGDPNIVDNVKWEQVTQEQINCLDIGEKLEMVLNPESERMEFWDNILK